ncbi:MAG: AAA family ATPase [Thermodesulfobacteriota bacterium]
MSTTKINPFRPNSPINPGMFVGRLSEIRKLESSLLQTKSENPEHFMITGERGIGKTSLLMYLKYVAEGSIKIEGSALSFLVVETDISHTTTQSNLVHKILAGLNKQLGKSEPARHFLEEAWGFFKRVKVLDSGIKDEKEKDEEVLVEEFAYSLAGIVERACNEDKDKIFGNQFDGVLILIDEADNASAELSIGSFCKLLAERLQKQGCNKVLFGLAGLTDLRQVLLQSHESSLRIFQDIELTRLSPEEVSRVIDICINKSNDNNTEHTKIKDDAKNELVKFSEGYPHFIQQFGHSAFVVDQDWEIDIGDVRNSFLGALEQIGNRYYTNDFYNKIKQESYRQVLRIMAESLDAWVSRQSIKEKFKGKETVMNNAINALRARHIIISKQGEQGVYRLQYKGFALWIRLCANPKLTRQ